jgi:hypothetical protein
MAGFALGQVIGLYVGYLGLGMDILDQGPGSWVVSRMRVLEGRVGTICDLSPQAGSKIEAITPASVPGSYRQTCSPSVGLTSNRCPSCGAETRNGS